MTILEEFSATFAGSRAMHEKARAVLPGGLSHDSRHMHPFPVFVDRAAGSRKWDVDGHELICYHMGHGALLLGHSHPAIVRAVAEQAGRGMHFGAEHPDRKSTRLNSSHSHNSHAVFCLKKKNK